ncbi:MAG TPA: TIGR03084 family metal-binding protein [Aeromicrobium sp.]|nr:TIGR03084 family metal-binding protein [Aeromicrobium sp.]
MNPVLESVLADLTAESEQLESWVTPIDAVDWSAVCTPEGWTVAHEIAHLAWTDWASLVAIGGGQPWDDLIMGALAKIDAFVDSETEEWAKTSPPELLAKWQAGRAQLAKALTDTPDGTKLKWFGPPMSPASMATARMMETWGHSMDVAEGLGIEVPRTDRCKHICHLGVRTRGYVYSLRLQEAPDVDVRVELTSPSGQLWTWGPEDADERIAGDAWDFALLAVRRRHRDDAKVEAVGAAADEWLGMVQAFAGPPGNDPKRLSERTIGS